MNWLHEHHLPVTRTARYYVLGTLGPATEEVWLALHGYGQRAAYFARHFRTLVRPGRAFVVPEALSRFYLPGHERVGASWMTKADRLHEIGDYVTYLETVMDRVHQQGVPDTVARCVLGFSQGAATASRWATMTRYEVQRLVAWGGALAHDLDPALVQQRLRPLPLTLVLGTEDAYLTPERRAAVQTWLDMHELVPTIVRYEGGHRLQAATLKQVVDG
ncbi:MAG: hypothetical protein AAGI71_13295 [Bacteroidota bacterium]